MVVLMIIVIMKVLVTITVIITVMMKTYRRSKSNSWLEQETRQLYTHRNSLLLNVTSSKQKC